MENGIILGTAMAEKRLEKQQFEVFGCIPHGRGAFLEFVHGVSSMGSDPMDGHG